MSSYDIVIDSSTRKDRATTDANNFTVYLSTPLYGIQSVNFASASIPYLNSASQVNGNVHAYYVVLEVPNYGILTDRIYTVDNPLVYGGKIVNTSATGNNAELTIIVNSPNGIEIGMDVTGTGIGTNAKVTNINGTTITLSVANSDTVSGLITFSLPQINNRFDFAYTGSLAVPSLAGASPTNYVMSSMNDRIDVQKTVPVMEAIKVSIYYYDTSVSSFKLYPFTNTGASTEEFVLKLSVQATKDKRFATKQQDEDDKRLEPNIAPPVTPGTENTFARKLINYYRSATRNKLNPEEPTEPVGALLPRREFMGVPTKYAQILIPIAVVLLVLAILLAK
jgi:hypothetical protein